MQVGIRCRYCGAREMITAGTLASLGGRGSLVRTCSTCRADTPWDVHTEATGFGGARLADDTVAVHATPRVLVVDDDTEILTVVSRALAGEGLEIETASSGREALNRMVREDFDLVLCDLRMPEFDGKQLFAFVEEHMADQKQNLMFLTGDTGTEATADFFRENEVPYLLKPLDLPALVKAVRERLGLPPGGEPVKADAAATAKW